MHVASGSASRVPQLYLPWQRYHLLQVIVISTKSQRLGETLKGHSQYQKSFFFFNYQSFFLTGPLRRWCLNYSRTQVGACENTWWVLCGKKKDFEIARIDSVPVRRWRLLQNTSSESWDLVPNVFNSAQQRWPRWTQIYSCWILSQHLKKDDL